MKSRELLQKSLGIEQDVDIQVSGISIDSRTTEPGNVFVAIPSAIDHTTEAIAKGAALIIHEGEALQNSENAQIPPEISSSPELAPSFVAVNNARLVAAKLCQHFYTPIPEKLLAVTGTNGKSSTVMMASQILSLLKIPSASLGTLGVNIPDIQSFPDLANIDAPPLTTYDPVNLHKILQRLAHSNISCAAIEATSHGLDQRRLDGLQFDAVALTNVTQDHLDYHHTMDAYLAAKLRLFSDLTKKSSSAILNETSPTLFFDMCLSKMLNVITYGINPSSNLFVSNKKSFSGTLRFDLRIYGQTFQNVVYNGIGSFQIENLLCAIGLILGAYPNLPLDDIVATIPHISPVPGRMELVGRHNNADIYVDFCHTPDALYKVLSELNKVPHNSLIVVFGCGGDRDKTKRPQMGAIADKLASRVIVTDDNPRFEDPASIRQDILSGISNLSKTSEIPDRKAAISQAIADLGKGDILLVAGRGHELYQKTREKCIPFSDKKYVEEVIEWMKICRK